VLDPKNKAKLHQLHDRWLALVETHNLPDDIHDAKFVKETNNMFVTLIEQCQKSEASVDVLSQNQQEIIQKLVHDKKILRDLDGGEIHDDSYSDASASSTDLFTRKRHHNGVNICNGRTASTSAIVTSTPRLRSSCVAVSPIQKKTAITATG